MKIQFNIAPNFIVPDLDASLAYYRDRLGFTIAVLDGEPPNFAVLQGLGACLMLKTLPEIKAAKPNHLLHPDLAWDAYLCVTDVDNVHADFCRRGAKVLRPPENAPYGLRDFEVQDHDGYILGIGQYLDNSP